MIPWRLVRPRRRIEPFGTLLIANSFRASYVWMVTSMISTERIAEHLRDVHVGKNWTAVNLKNTLSGVTWRTATRQVGSLHTIATLVYHINYYIAATIEVLRGGPLEAKDELSFDSPPIRTEEEWESLLNKLFSEAEELALLIEKIPDERLSEYFVEEKNGTYYRCLQGPIEHTYYHLGQIVLLKKVQG